MKSRRKKGEWWEPVVWTMPPTMESIETHAYLHEMLERKGYTRVDILRPGLYYTVDGDTFTWHQWLPKGRFLDRVLNKWIGFWELYRQAHEEDAFREAFNEAGV
jgi:hypothetical protein